MLRGLPYRRRPAWTDEAVLSALEQVAPLTRNDLRFILDLDRRTIEKTLEALWGRGLVMRVAATPRQQLRSGHGTRFAYRLREGYPWT